VFASLKIKKLSRALEEAAVEFTVADQLGAPPRDPSHSTARSEIVRAARSAIAAGKPAAVGAMLASAPEHPMFRGSNRDEWREFIASVRAQLDG
jgi:hypothetical protein